jgi:type II secretion system protein N
MALAAKNKKWLWYTLYVVLVTLALLYYLFPAQAVEELVDNSISRIYPELGFKADRIGPWIPAGLRIHTGQIYLTDSSAPAVFKAESMYIGPQLLKLVRGVYNIDMSGTAYKGELNGSLFAKDDTGETFESELSFRDFDLAEYEFLAEKLKHRVLGKLSGDIDYAKDSPNSGGNGKVDLRLTDGQLQFQAPIFGIGSVDMQNIDLEVKLRDREITIVRAELAGSEVKASMTGSIQLQADINLSQLNLKGTLEPLAEFYKNYPEIRELLKSMKKRVKRGQYFFAITGTLGSPRFRLL